VKLLVEQGGADPSLMDRWEQTPLDEARRVGAAPVVEYLAAHVTGEAGLLAAAHIFAAAAAAATHQKQASLVVYMTLLLLAVCS
jgi:ankyrin repeat protein